MQKLRLKNFGNPHIPTKGDERPLFIDTQAKHTNLNPRTSKTVFVFPPTRS